MRNMLSVKLSRWVMEWTFDFDGELEANLCLLEFVLAISVVVGMGSYRHRAVRVVY